MRIGYTPRVEMTASGAPCRNTARFGSGTGTSQSDGALRLRDSRYLVLARYQVVPVFRHYSFSAYTHAESSCFRRTERERAIGSLSLVPYGTPSGY